jgi:hypothetical protein
MVQQQKQFYSIFSDETYTYLYLQYIFGSMFFIVSNKFAHNYHIIHKNIFVQQIIIEMM